MRPYTTRPVKTGRFLGVLLLLTLLYIALGIPSAAAVATLISLAGAGEGYDPALLPSYLALFASGTYPLVALFSLVASWARYGNRRYGQALAVALLPLLNLALFGLAVGLARLGE